MTALWFRAGLVLSLTLSRCSPQGSHKPIVFSRLLRRLLVAMESDAQLGCAGQTSLPRLSLCESLSTEQAGFQVAIAVLKTPRVKQSAACMAKERQWRTSFLSGRASLHGGKELPLLFMNCLCIIYYCDRSKTRSGCWTLKHHQSN